MISEEYNEDGSYTKCFGKFKQQIEQLFLLQNQDQNQKTINNHYKFIFLMN